MAQVAAIAIPLVAAAIPVAASMAQNYLENRQRGNRHQYPPRGPRYTPYNRPYKKGFGEKEDEDVDLADDVGPAKIFNVDNIIHFLKSQLNDSMLVNTTFDKYHLELLHSNWHDNKNLYHILHYLYVNFLRVRDGGRKTSCAFCEGGPAALIVDQTRMLFFEKRRELRSLLVAMYQCNAATVEAFFSILMAPCNPKNGMFAYDLSVLLEARVKKLNQQIQRRQRMFYHGIIYNKSTSENLYIQHAAAIIKEASEYPRHVFLVATGTVIKPQHWCLCFIDLIGGVYINYNSLGGEKEFNGTLYNVLKEQAYPSLKLLKNDERSQGRSKLCGFFVYDMLYELACAEPENVVNVFKTYINRARAGYDQTHIDEVISNRAERYITDGGSFSLFESIFKNL